LLPTLALIVASLRKFLFIRDPASLFDLHQYSLTHFESVFDNPLTVRSIWNTLEVGLITAVCGGALAFAIGYTVHRASVPGRRGIDLISTLPVAIPGKPEYSKKQIGQVIAPSGGTTWTRVMFERQVLGEDYWRKQAATNPVLYPSGAPASDSLVRGEISIAPLLYNIVYPKKRDGAPLEIIFPPEGAPVNPFASGVPKSAAHPNAAKLFLNWCLSEEGQAFMIKVGHLTALKKAPYYPEGFDPNVIKIWVPDFDQYVRLHAVWVEDWNKTCGYRQ
jgi:iron(III) transport system substrate-binding protein